MIDAISTAQSGLSALATSMAATANNVANADTDGYRARDARLETGPGGQGVRVSELSEDTSSGGLRSETVSAENEAGIPQPGVDLVAMSNVDLASQAVNMVEVSRAFEANVAVIRTADDMAGTILDMRV